MTSESAPAFSSAEQELLFWKQKAQDYKQCLEETRDELEEFQSSSRDLEAELEAQLEQQETRCSDLRQQVNRLAIENQSYKERLEKEQDEFSGQLTKLQEELTEIKTNKEQLVRYVRELEQANDDLERAKRATLTSLEDFEARLNQAIERNAFLESELDEKETLKVMVQRLKDEARDLRQEVTVHRRNDCDVPDNDKAAKQQIPLLKQQLSLHLADNNQPIIDSNKLISENDSCSKTSTKCHNLHNLNNGSVPLTPSARISALNIVGDLLRKVGALESRLASCRTLVKDNQRPLSLPPGNHSAREEDLLTPLSQVSTDYEMIIV